MKRSRTACALMIGVVLAALGTPTVHAGGAPNPQVPTASVAPAALIDLDGLFADENEADEDEPGGGGSNRAQQDQQHSGTSLPVPLLAILLAILIVPSVVRLLQLLGSGSTRALRR
jgi:hypothetical protein